MIAFLAVSIARPRWFTWMTPFYNVSDTEIRSGAILLMAFFIIKLIVDLTSPGAQR